MSDGCRKDELATLLRENPVLCARYAEHRLSSFLKLMKSDTTLMGRIDDMFRITEEQQRGCKHFHGLSHDEEFSMCIQILKFASMLIAI